MAVRLKPCFGCPIPKTENAACLALRERMRESVRGIGLRSATFNCPVLLEACSPGTRVVIPQKYTVDGYDYFGGEVPCVHSADVPATILTVTPEGFSAVVDKAAFDVLREEANEDSFKDPERARFRRRMPFSRVKKFTGEPRREICPLGNAKDGSGKCDSVDCWCAQEAELIGASA